MRLINVRTMQLETHFEPNVPRYAILSHTWEKGEVSYTDFIGHPPGYQSKAGYQKIKYACHEAKKDRLGFVWVDTCCIDKSSSAELSEAIQSMFRWYRYASKCYAYLVDVPLKASFAQSRWWTRAWTLQELIAPLTVKFFDKEWKYVGAKSSLTAEIEQISRIPVLVLKEIRNLRTFSVAARMSWAAGRKATRQEDIAYSLLGIFGVNLPLLYGEGDQAFLRLQEEIAKHDTDQSLFAWGYREGNVVDEGEVATSPPQFLFTEVFRCPPLATSPDSFKGSGSLVRTPRIADTSYSLSNRGLELDMPMLRREMGGAYHFLGLLACYNPMSSPHSCVAVILHPDSVHFDEQGNYYTRRSLAGHRSQSEFSCLDVSIQDMDKAATRNICIRNNISSTFLAFDQLKYEKTVLIETMTSFRLLFPRLDVLPDRFRGDLQTGYLRLHDEPNDERFVLKFESGGENGESRTIAIFFNNKSGPVSYAPEFHLRYYQNQSSTELLSDIEDYMHEAERNQDWGHLHRSIVLESGSKIVVKLAIKKMFNQILFKIHVSCDGEAGDEGEKLKEVV